MTQLASYWHSLSALSTGDIPRRCPARARRRAAPTAAACDASTSSASVRESLTTTKISRRLLLSGSSSLVATGILTASHHPANAATDKKGGGGGGGKGASRPETVVYIGLTMDGFICRPNGDIDYLPVPNDSTEDYGFAAFLETVDAVVMGRKTYEQVVGFVTEGGVPWPYEGKTVTVAGGALISPPIFLQPQALHLKNKTENPPKKKTRVKEEKWCVFYDISTTCARARRTLNGGELHAASGGRAARAHGQSTGVVRVPRRDVTKHE